MNPKHSLLTHTSVCALFVFCFVWFIFWLRLMMRHLLRTDHAKGPRGGLFWANKANNFTIRGGPDYTPLGEGAVVGGAGQYFNHDFLYRSNMFTFVQCEDVLVTDLTVRNSSAWTLVPIFSKRVAFKRLHIAQGAHPGRPENPDHHANTDGFDPVGSEDASFEDSYYEGPGDDCVAIKSGIQVNWTIPYVDLCNRPSRRIYVNNVTCVAAHGITIGSEISGGVEDVLFTNMVLLDSPGGGVAMVKLKNACGRGGFVRNVHWENMTAGTVGNGISAGRYGTPASVNNCNATGTIQFSNLTAKNVFVASAVDGAYNIAGYKTPLAQQQFLDFTLENFTVKSFSAVGTCSNADVRLRGSVSPRFPTCTNSTPLPPPPPPQPPSRKCKVVASIGCYNDTGATLLPKLQPQLHDHVTFENCALACFAANSKIAGIDGGNHCSCGDEVADGASRVRPFAECAGQCHGNHDEKNCGGNDRMAAYSFVCA